ncbi:MAG TPA: methyltransferase domain-containing protein [Kofleriaceae bacterium]|jgi:SAM-dependent methyltransferase
MTKAEPTARPAYDRGDVAMLQSRAPQAAAFARQILDTVRPFMAAAPCTAIDIGCGYGHTAAELSRSCAQVVGIEPFDALASHARELAREHPNLEIRHGSVYDLADVDTYDLAVLDNVLEHLPDQPAALAAIARALRPGGALFLLVPNKLWPVEVHYHLPFLSYLPLSLANRYLRIAGKGTDYTDASYAPTYWRLRRLLDAEPTLDYHFTLPSNLSLAAGGNALHYKLGAAALRRFPALWAISKALLVIAVKHG